MENMYKDQYYLAPSGEIHFLSASDRMAAAATGLPLPDPAWTLLTDEQVEVFKNPSMPLSDLLAMALASVNAGAAVALSRLSAAYPDGEVQSWAQQTREAEALAADPQASAPLLTAIAAARGLAVTELASRVLTKVQAYAVASGQIIGQRQALEDAINAVDLAAPNAAEQLAAIQWPETSP